MLLCISFCLYSAPQEKNNLSTKSSLVASFFENNQFSIGVATSLVAGLTMGLLEYTARQCFDTNIYTIPFSTFKICSAVSAATLFIYFFDACKFPPKRLHYLCGMWWIIVVSVC